MGLWISNFQRKRGAQAFSQGNFGLKNKSGCMQRRRLNLIPRDDERSWEEYQRSIGVFCEISWLIFQLTFSLVTFGHGEFSPYRRKKERETEAAGRAKHLERRRSMNRKQRAGERTEPWEIMPRPDEAGLRVGTCNVLHLDCDHPYTNN